MQCKIVGTARLKMHTVVMERNVSVRNLDEHKARCANLEILTSVGRQYWGGMWGINVSSSLLC